MDRDPEQTQSTLSNIAYGIAFIIRVFNAMAQQNAEPEEAGTSGSFEELEISKRKPKKINDLLNDIYKQYIQIKDEDFKRYYHVFTEVFNQVNDKMKKVDIYYKKYSARKQCAGSHYDNLRIMKPSEFDVDIVVRLPANYNIDEKTPNNTDITIENRSPAYVKLRMGKQFQNIPNRDDVQTNVTAYNWMDKTTNYLLRSQFQFWFKSVVDKALNLFEKNTTNQKIVRIDGEVYTLVLKSSGPALTLVIRGDRDFLCEVDLVPALRMPEYRWPITKSHRQIASDCSQEYWMVVPKPNKNSETSDTEWRIALHDQEWKMMKNVGGRMKQGIRFLKKLRNAQNMNIASYYIKTLFFHEIVENESGLWSKSDAAIFETMVIKFHAALLKGEIPYFWHKGCNLLQDYHHQALREYAKRLEPLIKLLKEPDSEDKCMNVAAYLLTREELREYQSNFN